MRPAFRRIGSASGSLILLLALVLFPYCAGPSQAQSNGAGQQPEKIDQLLKLLDDPEVKAWISSKPLPPTSENIAEISAGALMVWSNAIRTHLRGVAKAVPALPGELARAGSTIMTQINGRGPGAVLALVAVFAGLGLGAELVFQRWILRRRRGSLSHLGPSTQAHHAIAASIFVALAPLAVFTIVSVGAFLVFNWPPLLAALVLPMLAALIAWRVMMKATAVLLAPGNEAVRLVALDDAHSLFWYRRVAWFAGVFLTGWAATGLMMALNFAPDVRSLIVYGIGLGLLAIALETIWRRPAPSVASRAYRIKEWGLTFYVCLLWILWVAGLSLAMWIGLYVLLMPPLLRTTTTVVKALFSQSADAQEPRSAVFEVLLERGARVVVIVLAVAWLGIVIRARASGLMEDDDARRIIRGVLGGVVILLAADLIWHIVKGLINRRIERARIEGGDEAALARSGRLMTLLPILRNFLAAFIIAIAAMMILSGLGVEIGPLIAGAGIFGVAIGFGSQSLVKDVISGVFYMTDDAFRVGEYIQSGSYKGTVESFSIRSVKLRHHRGPIFTVPFGSLGAVQNMSRDWVIDKFLISVTYDTDIAKVKKVVKGVGAKLLEDAEFGPQIIETVKMKGVETFGDYGINLSFAMMTKPGHQSTIRRRAYAMIREAFAENGIGFASPTVQVAGNEEQSTSALAAVTQDTMARKKAAETLKLVEGEG
ncbi:MAG: mechanosensitive ion channel domain-containing protein [Phyllobacterium sp.]